MAYLSVKTVILNSSSRLMVLGTKVNLLWMMFMRTANVFGSSSGKLTFHGDSGSFCWFLDSANGP